MEQKDALIEALKTDDYTSPTVTLIVCPTSVLATWMAEITKHVQEDYLKVLLYHGSNRVTDPAALKFHDVIVTSYGTLSNEFRNFHWKVDSREATLRAIQKLERENTEQIMEFFSLKYHRVVLDEAHMIRNRNTKTHKAVLNLRAKKSMVSHRNTITE